MNFKIQNLKFQSLEELDEVKTWPFYVALDGLIWKKISLSQDCDAIYKISAILVHQACVHVPRFVCNLLLIILSLIATNTHTIAGVCY